MFGGEGWMVADSLNPRLALSQQYTVQLPTEFRTESHGRPLKNVKVERIFNFLLLSLELSGTDVLLEDTSSSLIPRHSFP